MLLLQEPVMSSSTIASSSDVYTYTYETRWWAGGWEDWYDDTTVDAAAAREAFAQKKHREVSEYSDSRNEADLIVPFTDTEVHRIVHRVARNQQNGRATFSISVRIECTRRSRSFPSVDAKEAVENCVATCWDAPPEEGNFIFPVDFNESLLTGRIDKISPGHALLGICIDGNVLLWDPNGESDRYIPACGAVADAFAVACPARTFRCDPRFWQRNEQRNAMMMHGPQERLESNGYCQSFVYHKAVDILENGFPGLLGATKEWELTLESLHAGQLELDTDLAEKFSYEMDKAEKFGRDPPKPLAANHARPAIGMNSTHWMARAFSAAGKKWTTHFSVLVGSPEYPHQPEILEGDVYDEIIKSSQWGKAGFRGFGASEYIGHGTRGGHHRQIIREKLAGVVATETADFLTAVIANRFHNVESAITALNALNVTKFINPRYGALMSFLEWMEDATPPVRHLNALDAMVRFVMASNDSHTKFHTLDRFFCRNHWRASSDDDVLAEMRVLEAAFPGIVLEIYPPTDADDKDTFNERLYRLCTTLTPRGAVAPLPLIDTALF